MAATAGGSYTFQAEPRAVSGKKTTKYRPEQTFNDHGEGAGGLMDSANIHFDKRVYRGNTYSSHLRKIGGGSEQSSSMRSFAPGRSRPREPIASPFDMGLPRPERVPVDLLPHLVEEQKIIVESQNETQTDEFMPEVPAAEYVPRKTGIDRTTQVEDNDLFDFNREVEPLLEVLVNKSLEQALMEVEEEHEIESMAGFKEQWYKRQEIAMADWEAQVEAERRRQQEKDVKMKLAREKKQRETNLLLKLQAVQAAKDYLPTLCPNAVSELMQDNLFPNATLMAIQSSFLPEVFANAVSEVAQKRQQQELVDDMLKNLAEAQYAVKQQKRAEYAELMRKRAEEEEARRIAEAKKLGKIRISYEGNEIGPIAITTDDDIAAVHEKVFTWVQENNPELAALMPDGVELLIGDEPQQVAPDVISLFEAAKKDPGSIILRPVGTGTVEEPVEGEE